MKLTKSQIKELIRHSIRELTSEREDVTESKGRRFTVKEVRMWMKKLEENRYKKVYNSDARRVAWMVNNEGVELSEMPVSMSKKWTKAQYGRERYLATEFLKSKSEQMTEGKLTEKFNLNKQYIDAVRGQLKNVKKLSSKEIKAYKDTLIKKLDKNQLKVLSKAKVNHLSQLASQALGEGKLTSEQKLRQTIREILKEQLNLNEYVGAGKPIPSNKAKHLFVPENQMIRFSRVYKKLIQKGFVYIGDQSKEKKKISKHYTVTIDKKMYNDVLDSLMSKSFKIKT